MASTKLPGITSGTITIGGTDYEISSGDITISKEELEYTAISGDALAYPTQIEGGKVWAEGSIEAAWDTTLAGSGAFPAPFNPTALAAVVVNIGAKSLSFQAMVSKVQIKKAESGLVTISCDFKSSGAITFA